MFTPRGVTVCVAGVAMWFVARLIGSAGLDGLVYATGHYRNGILLAPITARLMTEWITGAEPSVSVKDFLPDRFARRPAR